METSGFGAGLMVQSLGFRFICLQAVRIGRAKIHFVHIWKASKITLND